MDFFRFEKEPAQSAEVGIAKTATPMAETAIGDRVTGGVFSGDGGTDRSRGAVAATLAGARLGSPSERRSGEGGPGRTSAAGDDHDAEVDCATDPDGHQDPSGAPAVLAPPQGGERRQKHDTIHRPLLWGGSSRGIVVFIFPSSFFRFPGWAVALHFGSPPLAEHRSWDLA